MNPVGIKKEVNINTQGSKGIHNKEASSNQQGSRYLRIEGDVKKGPSEDQL